MMELGEIYILAVMILVLLFAGSRKKDMNAKSAFYIFATILLIILGSHQVFNP